MTLTQVYWLITLPKFAEFGSTICFFAVITIVILLLWKFIAFISANDRDPVKPPKTRLWAISWIAFFIGISLSVFIPSHKEIVAMYGISYLTSNKDLQEIPPKLFELANMKLDDLITPLKE